jgi:selenocysteine-specific elongation factor
MPSGVASVDVAMSDVRHVVVGTAGHIDHGKSSLVEALTGTHPDRLEEERRRGITIELGYSDVDLGEGHLLSLVDVPGHERFVRHMVAGVAGIDAVLLVVAADEGPMPQTREHLDICDLLNIQHGLVALTKIDLVDPDLVEVVRLELIDALKGTFLANASLLNVSARTGEGMSELRGSLRELFRRVKERPADGPARLPVDRSFVLRGFGTVVTGTLYSGTLREAQEVEILPGGPSARIRGLQVHRNAVAKVSAGTRVAVNLQGVDCDQVPRGSTLATPAALRPTRRVWAEVAFLPGAPESLSRRGGEVRLHQGTCERWARLRVLRVEGDRIQAELILDEDTVLLPGDRFILRRPRPLDTVGGGRIVDAHPPGGAARVRARRLGFEALEAGDPILARVERAGVEGVAISELAANLGRSDAQIREDLDQATDRGIVLVGGRVFDERAWEAMAREVVTRLDAYHQQQPLRTGMRREDLRTRVARGWSQETWRALLDLLAGRNQIRLAGDLLARAGHRVVMSESDQMMADRLETRFLDGGFDPPEVDAVLRDHGNGRARSILDVLVERGRLVRIADGRLFHGERLAELRRRLAAYRERSSTIDVAAFKELVGVTRKNAIPLLEQMDAERVTRRVGNVREILIDTAA